jgi:hypothetical protein
MRKLFPLFLAITLALAVSGCEPSPSPTATPVPPTLTSGFRLTSPVFASREMMPGKYGRRGENISPPLEWSDPPQGTQSFALIFDTDLRPGGARVSGSTGYSTTFQPTPVPYRRPSRRMLLAGYPTAASILRTVGKNWGMVVPIHLTSQRLTITSDSTLWIRRSTWTLRKELPAVERQSPGSARARRNCCKQWRGTSWLKQS